VGGDEREKALAMKMIEISEQYSKPQGVYAQMCREQVSLVLVWEQARSCDPSSKRHDGYEKQDGHKRSKWIRAPPPGQDPKTKAEQEVEMFLYAEGPGM